MMTFLSELPPEDIPNKYSRVTGTTLARRTRERNFLLMRLHGMSAFASCLAMPTVVEIVQARIDAVKAEQEADTARTIAYRKKHDNDKK